MVDENTGEMVGIVCMTHETGKEVPDRKLLNPDGSFEPPKGFNFAFAGAVLGGLANLDAVMVGREHYSTISPPSHLSPYHSLQPVSTLTTHSKCSPP